MKLEELVTASGELAATRSRKKKAEILGGLLSRGDEETAAIIGFLLGQPRQGKLGVGYAGVFSADAIPATESTLDVRDVDAALDQLLGAGGPGVQAKRNEVLTSLFSRATEAEQEFLRRVLTGEVRHGALEGLLVDGLASATGIDPDLLRRAAMLSGSLPEVAGLALQSGEAAVRSVQLEVMRPVQPMLASSASDIESALGTAGHASVEWKLDGVRVQAHRRGADVSIYTRNLNDVTQRLGAVAEAVSRLDVESIVLDGEALSFGADGAPAPFQETMSRVGAETKRDEVPVVPFFFDVLHADGRDLIDLPLAERLQFLDELVPEEFRVPRIATSDAATATEFFRNARGKKHEGIMVKGLDTTYEAGRRGSRWLKVKPVHTLDLVILAAEWGSGRRKGWLSNLHLGARDEKTGKFVMLGKTFKGLTDEMLRWQTERFQELETRRTKYVVHVEPVVVAEIAFDSVMSSERYPGGMSLRFARVKRYRDDKTAEEADTIETVRRIFEGLE